MRRFIQAAAAAVLLTSLATAQAVPTLRFTIDNVVMQTCADGDGCDLTGAPGVVTFSGSVGDFVINVTTGVSKPVFTGGVPLMDLNTLNIQTQGTGHTLELMLSDDNFSDAGKVSGKLGGTLTGNGATISAQVYFDAGNALFDKDTLAGAVGPFGSGAFSGGFIGLDAPTGPYSVTQVLTLTTTGFTNFSADFEVSVPEPTTLALFGLGLLGLGAGWRRRAA
jgi:hypothetical protein